MDNKIFESEKGLELRDIFSKLENNPNDATINALYNIQWMGGRKIGSTPIYIDNKLEKYSFKERTDVIPDVIEFNIKTKIARYGLAMGQIVPFGGTVIVPTDTFAEDIVFHFDYTCNPPLVEWLSKLSTSNYPIKKETIVDDFSVEYDSRNSSQKLKTFGFPCGNNMKIQLCNMFPVSCDVSPSNVAKICFSCDYTRIEI